MKKVPLKDGFDYNGVWITNPHYEETGRFKFDTEYDDWKDEVSDIKYKTFILPMEPAFANDDLFILRDFICGGEIKRSTVGNGFCRQVIRG